MFGFDVKTVDVVEVAVPGLGDHRQRPPVAGGVRLALTNTPGDRRLVDRTDAVGVGDHDRALELAGLLDPGGAGHLAVAIERKPGTEDRPLEAVLAAWQHRRHPGPHRAAVGQVLDQGCVTDRDAGDVGNRVQRPRAAVEGDAEIPGARRFACKRKTSGQNGQYEHRVPPHDESSF